MPTELQLPGHGASPTWMTSQVCTGEVGLDVARVFCFLGLLPVYSAWATPFHVRSVF